MVECERACSIMSLDLVYSAVYDTADYLDDVNFDHLIGTPPGVWVVSPDQHRSCLHIARRLAGMGVIRTVFLQEFEVLALEFAGHRRPVVCQ